MTDRSPTRGGALDSVPAGVANAETFVGAGDRPIAGGRWHVLADDSVLYERRPGEFEHAVLTAATLRGNSTWRRAGS